MTATLTFNQTALLLSMEILLAATLFLPTYILTKLHSHNRGYIHTDATIYYPYRSSTVPSWLNNLLACIIPLVIVCITTILTSRGKPTKTIVAKIIHSMRLFIYFAGGWSLMIFIVHLTKYKTGMLRPHFINVCNPVTLDTISISNSSILNNYVSNYTCRGTDGYKLREVNKSFPSGHTAVAMYAAIYCCVYLSRLRRQNTWCFMCVPIIQMMLMLSAVYCGITRIVDNKHHQIDVVVGGIIGGVMGRIMANYYIPLVEIKQ